MDPTRTVLETRELSVGYGHGPVIRDVSLTVSAGEIVTLLGRNGAGKTTTIMSIAGVLAPIDGKVELDGSPAVGPLQRRARRGLRLIPETRAVVRGLSVKDNLRLSRTDVDHALGLFPELSPLLGRPAGLLSGGEQQMLALGRVLAGSPKLLLVDELSFGLAPLVVRRLLEAIRTQVSMGETGVLLVEQQPLSALGVADRGYVMASGQIVLSGAAEDLRSRLSEIEETYLSGAMR